MYNQFGKKTSLIEKKRKEGRRNNNNNPLSIDEDLFTDLVDLFLLFCFLAKLNYSLSFLSALEPSLFSIMNEGVP